MNVISISHKYGIQRNIIFICSATNENKVAYIILYCFDFDYYLVSQEVRGSMIMRIVSNTQQSLLRVLPHVTSAGVRDIMIDRFFHRGNHFSFTVIRMNWFPSGKWPITERLDQPVKYVALPGRAKREKSHLIIAFVHQTWFRSTFSFNPNDSSIYRAQHRSTRCYETANCILLYIFLQQHFTSCYATINSNGQIRQRHCCKMRDSINIMNSHLFINPHKNRCRLKSKSGLATHTPMSSKRKFFVWFRLVFNFVWILFFFFWIKIFVIVSPDHSAYFHLFFLCFDCEKNLCLHYIADDGHQLHGK